MTEAELLEHLRSGMKLARGSMRDFLHLPTGQVQVSRTLISRLRREKKVRLSNIRGRCPVWVLTEQVDAAPAPASPR